MSDECGCVYMSDDGDRATFSETTRPIARREHKCYECGEVIPRGAKYERVSGLWDREMSTFKTCLTCVEIRNELCCDGWVYGFLWEAIDEYFGEGGKPFGCINKLESVAAKTKLADAYREWLELEA